jgi:putative SbcD/Mre11-related phosphoesterase
VADLHLGCAWAHRHGGNLVPLSPIADERERLRVLVDSYAPKKIVLLGDIVHRAVPVPALKEELCAVIGELSARAELILIAGNHDRRLQGLLAECGLSIPLLGEFQLGDFLLTHGDSGSAEGALLRRKEVRAKGGRILIGHEHPAISVSDGVATSAKCPCFLVGEEVIILPAFSGWAAGGGGRRFLSPYARGVEFPLAVAILGDKLLPVKRGS